MNDEKFIEQLNAYLDRELSGVEMREVETAIAASPERQKIYRDYCKIERACQTLLASEVKAPKPSIAAIIAAANAQSNDNVVPFTPAQASRPRISDLSHGFRARSRKQLGQWLGSVRSRFFCVDESTRVCSDSSRAGGFSAV